MIRAIVGCECSGAIRRALRALGYDAWSVDLKPAEDGSPYHIQDDVLAHLDDGWDLGIFHPTCKYLTNSGGRWLYLDGKKSNGRDELRWDAMREGAEFFLKLWNAPIEHIAVENPVMHGHAKAIIGVEPSQCVQPWWFGHLEVKGTCWWLKNLPKLVPTNNVKKETFALPYKERAKVHYCPPRADREAERSRTLAGPAAACAEQWGNYVTQQRFPPPARNEGALAYKPTDSGWITSEPGELLFSAVTMCASHCWLRGEWTPIYGEMAA